MFDPQRGRGLDGCGERQREERPQESADRPAGERRAANELAGGGIIIALVAAAAVVAGIVVVADSDDDADSN